MLGFQPVSSAAIRKTRSGAGLSPLAAFRSRQDRGSFRKRYMSRVPPMSDRRWSGCRRAFAEGAIRLSARPNPVQHNGELPRDGDDSTLSPVRSAALGDAESPPLEIAIRAERTEQMLSALDQELARERIARLGDPSLRVRVARLVLGGRQAQECRHDAASLE